MPVSETSRVRRPSGSTGPGGVEHAVEPSRNKTALAARLNGLAETITEDNTVVTSRTQAVKRGWFGKKKKGIGNFSGDHSVANTSKAGGGKKKGMFGRLFRGKKSTDVVGSTASSTKVDSDQLVMDFFDVQSTVSESHALGMLSGKKHSPRDPYETKSVTSQRSIGSFFARFRQRKERQQQELIQTTITADINEEFDDDLTLGSGLVSDAGRYVIREKFKVRNADHSDGDFSSYAGREDPKDTSSSSAATRVSDAESCAGKSLKSVKSSSSSKSRDKSIPPVLKKTSTKETDSDATDSPTESNDPDREEEEVREVKEPSEKKKKRKKKGKNKKSLDGSQHSTRSAASDFSVVSGASDSTAGTQRSTKSKGSVEVPHVPKSTIESLEALLPKHEAMSEASRLSKSSKKSRDPSKKKKKKKNLGDSNHSRSSVKSSSSVASVSSAKSVSSHKSSASTRSVSSNKSSKSRSSTASKTPEERALAKARRKARKARKAAAAAAKAAEEEEEDFVPIMGEAKGGKAPDRWSPSPTPAEAVGSPKRPARSITSKDWRTQVYDAGNESKMEDSIPLPLDDVSDDGSDSVFSLLSGLMATWVSEQDDDESRDGSVYPKLNLRPCLKQGGPVEEGRESLRVGFSKIEIREYERTVGDNPACGSGPPITIGWNYVPGLETDIDAYETTKKPRSKKQYYLPPSKRTNILLEEWQCTDEQIRKARREATYIQYCREKSAFSKADKEAAFLRQARQKRPQKTRKPGSGSPPHSRPSVPPSPRLRRVPSDRQPKPTPAPLRSSAEEFHA